MLSNHESPLDRLTNGNRSMNAKHIKFKSTDVVDLSFHSIYATEPRKRHLRPNSKGDESGESDNEISEKVVEQRIAYIHRISRGPSLYQNIGSSYKRQFDAVLTVGLRYARGTTRYEPYVKDVFPGPECINASVDDVAHFCFPDADGWKPTMQRETYTFVLTNEKGERTFGYCRRVKPEGVDYNIPVVYCIISPILARVYYSQVLSEMERRHGLAEVKRRAFLRTLRVRSVPQPGRSVTIKCPDLDEDGLVILSRSSDFSMDNADVFRLLSQMSVSVLLRVFSSLLLERRVLFRAGDPGTLTESTHALLALLHPFVWQHTLVPVLPPRMLEVVASPTPYVIGVLHSCAPHLEQLALEEGIAVDLDTSQLIREFGDERTILPKVLHHALSTALKLINSSAESGPEKSSLMSHAFLTLFVELVGHFKNHISTFTDGQRIFHRESFCSAPTSGSVRLFLKWFTETSMFERFIEERTATSVENDVFGQAVQERHTSQGLNSGCGGVGPLSRPQIKELGKRMRNLGEKLIGFKPAINT